MDKNERNKMIDDFLARQDHEWDEHRRRIGLLGRIFEDIFGSPFLGRQTAEMKAFKSFLESEK